MTVHETNTAHTHREHVTGLFIVLETFQPNSCLQSPESVILTVDAWLLKQSSNPPHCVGPIYGILAHKFWRKIFL